MSDLLKHVEYIYNQCEQYKPIGTIDETSYHLSQFKDKLEKMEKKMEHMARQIYLSPYQRLKIREEKYNE